MKVSVWKVVFGLVLIALLVGAGGMIYRVGYARGTMSDVSFAEMPFAEGGYEGMTPYGGMPYMRTHGGYTGFQSIGGMLFGGFIFLLIVGGIFRLIFGGMWRRGCMPPWAMHRMQYEGEGTPPWMRYHPYWGKMNPDGEEEAKEETEK